MYAVIKRLFVNIALLLLGTCEITFYMKSYSQIAAMWNKNASDFLETPPKTFHKKDKVIVMSLSNVYLHWVA